MEYIKRDKAIARFTFEQGNYIPEKVIDGHDNVIAVRTIKRVLRELPAEDVAPVRHGRWIMYIPPMYTGDALPRCSECRMTSDVKTPFCAQCGARMDGEDEHD